MKNKRTSMKQVAKLVERAVVVMNELERMKSLYSEIDSITDQLVDSDFRTFKVENGVLTIVDNFAAKNKMFKTTSVKRYELQIEKERK